MTERQITYVTSRELLAEHPQIAKIIGSLTRLQKMARQSKIPHYKRGKGRIEALHPLEIVQDWLNGKPVAEHWMRGELAPSVPDAELVGAGTE